MKLCPQCAFIYEDHQRVCDMDGQKLVPDSAPAPMPAEVASPISFAAEPKTAPPTRLNISLAARPEDSPASVPASPSKRWPLLVILLVVLATLFSVLVVAQVRRSRSSHAFETSEPERSMALDSKPQPANADLKSATSVAGGTVSEPSPESAQESAAANVIVSPSLTHPRLASSPVSAAAPGANSRTVILRLTNGAIINADEVWERKEGIWYQQAGMVTFISRKRVRSIERLAPPRAPQKTATVTGEERIRASGDRTTQNQLRLRRLEAVETKKPSRVKSFLKLTGRMLKKPFKM